MANIHLNVRKGLNSGMGHEFPWQKGGSFDLITQRNHLIPHVAKGLDIRRRWTRILRISRLLPDQALENNVHP